MIWLRCRRLNFFGSALAGVEDVGGDGVGDMAVGAIGGDGDVLVLELIPSGQVTRVAARAYGATLPGGAVTNGQYFGIGVARWGDVDGDGLPEVLVGAWDVRGTTPTNGATTKDGGLYVVWLM